MQKHIFQKLLLRVHSGEEIIIAKAGKPYAKLVPLKQVTRRIPGIAKGKVTNEFLNLCLKKNSKSGNKI